MKFTSFAKYLPRMGAWSEDIFGNDMACDVRDVYRERISAGDSAEAAFKHLKKQFAEELREAEDKRLIYIALAATQLEAGQVTDIVRETALKAIAWCEHPNHDAEEFPFNLAVLATLREKLGGKAPPARKPSKPKVPPGAPGDVYVMTLPADGFCAELPDKLTEAVIFVGNVVTQGGRGPDTARVVVLYDLSAKDVTVESVAKSLSDWKSYHWLHQDGKIGRGIFHYDASGKLPARKVRLLLRGMAMPKNFVCKMRDLGAVYQSTVLPWVVDQDLKAWRTQKMVPDPELDRST